MGRAIILLEQGIASRRGFFRGEPLGGALEVVAKEGVVAHTTRATTASAIAHLVHPVITPDRLGLSERR